jgi:hypothetical protein
VANGINTEKSIGTVINELKFEFREFVQTRLQILREEMKTKTSLLKIAVPMFAIALVLAAVVWSQRTEIKEPCAQAHHPGVEARPDLAAQRS